MTAVNISKVLYSKHHHTSKPRHLDSRWGFAIEHDGVPSVCVVETPILGRGTPSPALACLRLSVSLASGTE